MFEQEHIVELEVGFHQSLRGKRKSYMADELGSIKQGSKQVLDVCRKVFRRLHGETPSRALRCHGGKGGNCDSSKHAEQEHDVIQVDTTAIRYGLSLPTQ